MLMKNTYKILNPLIRIDCSQAGMPVACKQHMKFYNI